MERIHLLIQGRVQGVYYRASTHQRASQLGVTGWVRNLPDGRVEVLAEGDEAQLQALYDFCCQGPPGARVDHIETGKLPARGDLGPGFRIER